MPPPVLHSKELLGVKMSRHFSETSHGKGVCDGIGGMSKFTMSRAVLQEKVTIKSAYDYFKYGKENLEKDEVVVDKESGDISRVKRTYLWIPSSEIKRERPERNYKTVNGTRMLHAAKPARDDKDTIYIRDLSCFCDNCMVGNDCENKYAGPWKTVKLQVASESM